MSSLASAQPEFTKRSEFSKSPSATGASNEPPLHANERNLITRARWSLGALGKAVPLALAQLYQFALSGDDFAGAQADKCESNQWGAPVNRL